MTITAARPVRRSERSPIARLAPLSGLAAVGLIVVALFSDAGPTSRWTDARIENWYASHSITPWLLESYVLAFAAPLLLLFVATVGARLRGAGAGETALKVLNGGGSAFAATLLVGAGLYAAVPASMTFAGAPAPTAAVSRAMLGASYGILVMFMALAAALVTLTISVAALRARILPRWVAIGGIPAAILMLANAVLPMAVIALWFAVLSIAVTVTVPREAGTA